MKHSHGIVAASLAMATATAGCHSDLTVATAPPPVPSATATTERAAMGQKVIKSEDEWRQQMTPEQYAVCRLKGTERAFTGKYWDNHLPGIYRCAACGTELFGSDTKFDSGTGWPSFWSPLHPENIATEHDTSLFMSRTEVKCAVCGSHLGHVFNDGPPPTGLRYCLNSVCLDFEPKPKE